MAFFSRKGKWYSVTVMVPLIALSVVLAVMALWSLFR